MLARLRRRRPAVAIGTTVVGTLAVGLTAVALGTSLATAAPQPTIPQVQAEVAALQIKAESAAEQYNAAHLTYTRLMSQLSRTKAAVAAQQATLGRVESTIGQFAAATYQNGGIDASLQLLLADNPTQFLAQASVLDQIAANQNTALRSTKVARLALMQTLNTLAQEEAAAAAANKAMGDAKAQIDASLNATQAVLNTLQQAQRDELARQEALKRQEAQAAAERLAHQHQSGGGGSGGSGVPPVSGRAGIAVAYALSKVGDPYVAGASGPDAFDCSGLTMAAWAQAGVSLSHYSYDQYGEVTHIALSDIRPGDLLFYFGNGVHHVDMYVGNGLIVSASNPWAGVEVIDMNGPGYYWWANVFTGAGRPG